MHRHILRAARQSLVDSREKFMDIGHKNTARKVRSSQTFSGSRDTDNYQLGWRCEPVARSVQLQIVNALRLGEREGASKMLSNLAHVNTSLHANDFAYILDYCAQTCDPLFALETWKIMEEKGIDVDKECCRSIFRALSKGGYLKEASGWLNFVGENDSVHAVLPWYNIFLGECGNKKSFIDADRCLELMEARLLGKSEITYWELLKLAVLQKNLSAVHEIWKDCTRYYSPSIVALRKFVWSFTRLNDLQSAYTVLKHMVALAHQKDVSLRKSAAGRYQSSRLDIPIPSLNKLPDEMYGLMDSTFSLDFLLETTDTIKHGLGENCMDHSSAFPMTIGTRISNVVEKDSIDSQMFPFLVGAAGHYNQHFKQKELTKHSLENAKRKELGFKVPKRVAYVPVKNILRWSFNNMIHACARSRNYKLSEHLFLQMDDLGLKPSQDTYDGFVKAVIYEKGVAYGMKVVESMEKRNIKPYNDTLAALATGHSTNLELDVAEPLLQKISDGLPKYIHSFNDFLAACDIMDQPERAVRILAKMKRLKIKSNIRTYELLISLFGNVNIPYERGNILSHVDVSKRIRVIEKDMIRSGVQHSFTSMKNLIRALGAEGMIQEMLQYLNKAENMLWDIDPYERTDIYNIVLHALVKAKESHTATEVFKNMISCGFPANVATYNMMIECCSILTCFNSACALVSLMLRDGFYPQTLTYTALAKVLLASDDFDGAMNLLDQASSEGIQLDIQLFNTILREAYFKGRIDIIELIIELIHREKIQPDPSTCWYTLSAYVECGFHNTGMEALQVLSLRMISEEDSILQEERAALQDLVYSEDPEAESLIIEIFKESREFLATALLNLRWCAINGNSTVLVSWSPEESFWAKRLSSSYDVKRGAT